MPENVEKKAPKGNIKFSITLSDEQKTSKAQILNHPFSFIIGQAGSGKTLLACQVGLDMFFKRTVNKIVVTRPTVSNEDNGFLPGILDKMMVDEQIELVSLSHFRGRTFENSIVIVDEFQNLTKQQLLMVLGRVGKGSTMILCGDPQQIDLKFRNDSAIHEVPKLKNSKWVYDVVLKDNHRHESLNDILRLLTEY
jgi:phosphate starvation-inducible PhoH-like protein